MEAHEASMVDSGRWLRIVVGIVALVALAPVAGMVLAFAIIPALPIVLAIGYVLGPMNWLADLEDRKNGAPEPGRGASPWIEAQHPRELAHA